MLDQPAVTEQIFEPSAPSIQRGPPATYPWLFTFTGEDVLELTSWNSASGVRLAVQGRVHTPDRGVIPFAGSHTPATTRVAVTTVHTVPLGDLLNVVVFADTGAPLLGETFVRLAVRRGAGAAFTRLGVLIQGPATALRAQAWPGSPIMSSLDVEPVIRALILAAPGAGNDIFFQVPTGARWEMLSLKTTLVLGAAGVAGMSRIQIGDAALNIWYEGYTLAAGGANTTNPTTFAQGTTLSSFGLAGVGTATTTPIPPNRLTNNAGVVIHSDNAAAQVTWGFQTLNVREWLDVN